MTSLRPHRGRRRRWLRAITIPNHGSFPTTTDTACRGHDDGGRDAVAPKADDELGDCVTCAIAIADRRPYAEVNDMVDKFGRAAGYLGIAAWVCRTD